MIAKKELLGREQELETLRTLIGGGNESGGVLLILGEPGIGKTALLSETRATARRAGFRVLAGAGAEGEAHLPFGGLHQILSPLLGALDKLVKAERDALSTAFGLADGPSPDLFLIAEASLSLLMNERGQRPVLVVADDVQWLDPQSAQVTTFLGHRAGASSLVVIGAARSGHEGTFMAAGFPELSLTGVDTGTADAILLAHGRELTPADRGRVREQARGNPLALLELPAVWADGVLDDQHPLPLSARLEQAFAGRIGELPPVTRDALLIAAVASSNDLHEIIDGTAALGAEVHGLPDSDLLGPAVQAGLVLVDAETLSFRHPLVRSGVLQTVTVAARHSAHAALASVLATAHPYRSVWHRAHAVAGPDDAVADDLADTVVESLRRGAVMAAVASLERAAQLTSSSARRGSRLLEAAQHAFSVGRPDVVARLVREAAGTELSDLERARKAWLDESLNDDVSADPARISALVDAAELSAAEGDLDLALHLLLGAALRCWWADNGPAAPTRVLVALDGLDTAHVDPRYLAALSLAAPVLRAAEVLRRLDEVVVGGIDDAESLRLLGLAAYGVGDLVRATDYLDRAADLLRESGRLGLLPVVLALQLHIRLDLGEWAAAAAAAQEVDKVSVETGQPLYAFNNVLVESRGLALRGEWQSALELIVGAEDEAARASLNDAICLGYQTRGAALLSGDRPADAFGYLSRQFNPSDPGYHLRESFAGVALMAEAAVDSGCVDEARATLVRLETVAKVTPSPLLQANLLFARAVLASPREAGRRYEEALAHDLRRWPWLHARIELEHGRWLISRGRAEEAVSSLRSAHEVFTRMGAQRWLRRTDTALLACRAAVPGSRAGADHRSATP